MHMDFLDKLILGKNTPRHSENVQYPSKVYKKQICNKKHCTQSCVEEKDIWEFWATFLAKQPVIKKEVRDKIKYMKDQLRFSVWIKLIENDQDNITSKGENIKSKGENEQENITSKGENITLSNVNLTSKGEIDQDNIKSKENNILNKGENDQENIASKGEKDQDNIILSNDNITSKGDNIILSKDNIKSKGENEQENITSKENNILNKRENEQDNIKSKGENIILSNDNITIKGENEQENITSNDNILSKEEINLIIERDKFLLKCVISKYRDKNEDQIFKILRKIVDTTKVENFILLIDFTYLITELPNCSTKLLDKLMTVLFTKYKFNEVFKSNEKDNINIKKFENLVYKEYYNLYKIIDKILCYDTELSFILEKYPSNGPIIIEDQEKKPVYCKEETYFDFLVIQNENIKAQEIIKNEQMELKKRNEELENLIKQLTSTDKE